MYGDDCSLCANTGSGAHLTSTWFQHGLACVKENARPIGMMGGLILLPFVAWHIPFVQQGIAYSHMWCQGPWAWLWFLLVAVPYCAAGLPRQALCIGAGAAFGVGTGILMCSVAYEVGALIDYAVGRAVGDRWSSGMLRPIASFMRSSPFRGVLSVRLLPVGSSLLVSVAAGGLRLPWVSFAAASALGGLPQTVIFVLMGSGLPMGHRQEIGAAVVLFVFSVALGMVLIKRYRAGLSSTQTFLMQSEE